MAGITRIIRGKDTGDILGYLQPNGLLEDIQGRKAVVADYGEALDKMREWSWNV